MATRPEAWRPIVEVPDLDVAKVREKTGLSQDRFAGAFAINISMLRNWEQGRTRPGGAARVLLTVIALEIRPASAVGT
jgi:putative transcriptional regulator